MSLSDLPSSLLDAVVEIHSLLPDSILFGSLLLYFMTHHLAIGVFALFLMEMVGAHRLASWVFSESVGPTKSSGPLRCRAGYKTPQYQYQRIFAHEAYPSYSIFSITSIATYLGLSTRAFSATMEQMGEDWTMRTTVTYSFIAFFLLSFLLARLWSCEGKGEVMIAMSLAVLTGLIFFYINKAVFGVEAVNFLGLPYLVQKDKQGTPIYVCGVTETSSS